MPAASDCGRSAACSETLRSRFIADVEARMGQNPAHGNALPPSRKKLVELMKSAEWDINQPCGSHESENLQRVLAPEYRLKFFQFKIGACRLTLEPVYNGLRTGTRLNVLLDEEHNNTILSMPGVLGCPYHFHYCNVGYGNVEDHCTACPYQCSFCLADTPCAPDGTSVYFSECKGFFNCMAC